MSKNKYTEKAEAKAKEAGNLNDKEKYAVEDVVADVDDSSEELNEVEDDLTKTQKELDETKAALEKEKNEYLFLAADFDNYRKRVLKEKAELLKNGAEKTLFGLLPIVDDFERGLAATKDAEDAASVREGMELIYNKLVKYLSDNGVKEMDTKQGSDFDADLHEAIATIPAPAEDLKGKIIDTTQKGYMINDKVLRHAKVVVGE
ncbi:MAG: nucleotide exchange factor GrpE [Muribaculaceae bacterium]